MISGAHVVLYSENAEADRAFFRDIFGFPHVEAGDGWLIFAMPPAELAIHPAHENDRHELFFMCQDLKTEMAALASKSSVPRCSKRAGGWSRKSNFRVAAGSVFTSQGIELPRKFSRMDECCARLVLTIGGMGKATYEAV